MTAEVAILNKTAVALAADSAVTISAGTDQQKVFDSEDKLFELSRADAIGVMINSNMHFLEAPLPVLIKRYRAACPRFERVQDAAGHFLDYLQKFGAASPADVCERSIFSAVLPIFTLLHTRWNQKFQDRLFGPESDPGAIGAAGGFDQLRELVLLEQIAVMARFITEFPDTELIGAPLENAVNLEVALGAAVDDRFDEVGPAPRAALVELAKLTLRKRVLMSAHTGIVFAGFGSADVFPTLISYELFGCVDGQLRVFKTNEEDIDRAGPRARVIPFAQKEMVERFLYGLDDTIQRRITDFCRAAIPRVRDRTMEKLDMSDEDRELMIDDLKEAEDAILEGLRLDAFEALREQSRLEIEDMVEFMPKSEMARMAEALVNLTSIKRRVSRGVETVGGPIDCAVISQADGFVWVKRKHYFPSELNNRYFDRMREQISTSEA